MVMTSAASSTEPILSPSSAIAALAGDDNQIRYYAACGMNATVLNRGDIPCVVKRLVRWVS